MKSYHFVVGVPLEPKPVIDYVGPACPRHGKTQMVHGDVLLESGDQLPIQVCSACYDQGANGVWIQFDEETWATLQQYFKSASADPSTLN